MNIHIEKQTMTSTKSLSRGQVKQKGNLKALYSLPLDLATRSLFATDSDTFEGHINACKKLSA